MGGGAAGAREGGLPPLVKGFVGSPREIFECVYVRLMLSLMRLGPFGHEFC